MFRGTESYALVFENGAEAGKFFGGAADLLSIAQGEETGCGLKKCKISLRSSAMETLGVTARTAVVKGEMK